MKKVISLLLTLIFFSVQGYAVLDKKAEVAKLRQKLSETDSPRDSIKILYDIFDLSSRKDYWDLGWEIDGVAARLGDNAIRYNIARHIADANSNDSVLALVEAHVKSLPEGKEQKETALFVRIKRSAVSVINLSEKELRGRIARTIVPEDNGDIDDYEQVERLFTICEYLSNFAKGDLLVEYLNDLGELIKEAKIECYALQNIYYTESANIYSAIGQHEKAVASDKALLKAIDNLEKRYKKRGRKYCNYDVERFQIYSRILSNYEALSLNEVNNLYDKVLELVRNNDDVKAEIEMDKSAAAYHAMKNGRYAEAIPYIRRQLTWERSKVVRKVMLEMLVKAAAAIGDQTNVDLAQRELDAITAEFNSKEARDKYNELKIRYDVSTLRAQNAELELENKNEQIEATRRIMVFVIAGSVAFAIMLIALLFFWTRYRHTSAGIASFVDSLAEERDAVKRRVYSDPEQKAALSEHAELYKSARPKPGNISETVDYIINDVMFISSVAFQDRHKHVQTFSMVSFIKDSVETLETTVTKDVRIDVVYPEEDFEICTDKECLRMLVDHILHVAMRLAPQGGSVGMECSVDNESGMVRLVFLHSGKSLPVGKEERIFEHFFDYKELSESGEGAQIMCRMINFLTGCSMKSEAGHTPGGKLVLMLNQKWR